MIKRIFTLTIVLIFCFLGAAAADDSQIEVRFNGEEIKSEISPVIIDSTIMVPVGIFSKAMGFECQWDDSAQELTITSPDKKMIISLNSNTAIINGSPVKLAAPAQLVGANVMIPLQAVCDCMGLEMIWDSQNSVINLYNTAKKINGKTAKEFISSLSAPTGDFTMFKFEFSRDAWMYTSLNGKQDKRLILSTAAKAIRKGKQTYSSMTFSSPSGTVNLEIFAEPHNVYSRGDGKAWQLLEADDLEQNFSTLMINMDIFNNTFIKKNLSYFFPRLKIVYGDDKVFNNNTYQTIIIDSKDPKILEQTAAALNLYVLIPKLISSSSPKYAESVEYAYFNKKTGNIELRKRIYKLTVTNPNYPDSEVVFTSEENYRIWDIGMPVEFPAQPPETK